MKSKRDVVIIVTGPKGEGKSTFSIHLAKLIDPAFTFERNMIFSATADKIIDKIVSLPFFSAIIVDEAITTTYKREWQDELNIALNKAMGRMRKFYKVLIFNIPEISFIDSDIRRAWCDIWIEIPQRGKALIFMKDKFVKLSDPWHLKYLDEQIDIHVKTNNDIDAYIETLARLPRHMFVGEFYVPKLDEEEENRYIQFFGEREALAKEMKEGRTTRKIRKALERAIWFLEELGFKEVDISSFIKVRQQLVSDYLERKKIDELLIPDTQHALRLFNVIINNKGIPMSEAIEKWKEEQHNTSMREKGDE